MAKQERTTSSRSSSDLHWGWRVALICVSLVSIFLALALYAQPPLRETITGLGSNQEARSVTRADPTTFSVALLALGGLCFLLGANGRKISKLSSSGVDMDVPSDKQVADDAKHAGVAADKSDTPPPPADALPETGFVKDGEEYQVYPPKDIPVRVLQDVMAAENPPIQSLADVAYGFRRIGQGNHAWFVKAKNGTTLQVSYGGRGKTEGTVAPATAGGVDPAIK